jgi:hypothetical protein
MGGESFVVSRLFRMRVGGVEKGGHLRGIEGALRFIYTV